jgi:2-C-methyl-D-erythritol 4-phosphate cytidylyltransferase
MTDVPVDDPIVAAAQLPRRHSADDHHAAGRARDDWTLVLAVPASIAGSPALLETPFAGATALRHCLDARLVEGAARPPAVVAVADALFPVVRDQVDAADVHLEVVAGQADQRQCLAAALAHVRTDYVVVHDVRRALASADLMDRVLDRLREGGPAVHPALEVTDSVKRVSGTGAVEATVDRTRLRSLQYPRGYRRATFAAILDGGGPDAVIIDGDPDAFVVEVPRDVDLAEAIIACRAAGER